MAQEAIRVLVVEDHHVVRQGLVALLNVVDGLEVVGEAADGVEAIAQYRKHQPDIALIDLRLPRLSGVEVIQRIRMETPGSRFIVLTTYDGDEDIYRALQAGARAYLLKGMTTDELIATIRTVHAGKSHIPPAIAQRLAERMGTEELTPRESDVLEEIVHGKSNKEIATELDISEATVKTHINSLLGKLGVTDRTQAATAALQRGLVTLESLRKPRAIRRSFMNKPGRRIGFAVLVLTICPAMWAQKTTWRQATDAELAAVLPARAPVEKEHIETEMRTASGIVDGHGRYIAGRGAAYGGLLRRWQVLSLPAGAGADHDWRTCPEAGEYVLGWDRSGPKMRSRCVSTWPLRECWWEPRKPIALLDRRAWRACTSGRRRIKRWCRSGASGCRMSSATGNKAAAVLNRGIGPWIQIRPMSRG